MRDLSFDAALRCFQGILALCEFPESLLWTNASSHRLWRRRLFVLVSGQDALHAQAEMTYLSAQARSLGLAFEAVGKTATQTICRIYAPTDETDAQNRFIPKLGLKHVMLSNPLPVVLVQNPVLWRLMCCATTQTLDETDVED
jgi:hypothetical protein